MLGTDQPLAGVELDWDDCLAADNGVATYQRGADGVRLPGTTETVVDPVHGGDVVLTLDSDLQWYVLQQLAEHGSRLGAEHGYAMVVRVSDAIFWQPLTGPLLTPTTLPKPPHRTPELGFFPPPMSLGPS